MRKSLIFCGVVVALLSTATSTSSQTEYELAHQEEEIERQAIVAANLSLLDSEAEAFWDLYVEYRAADREMDDQRADLMRRFAESYEDFAEDEGNRLVKDTLELEEQRQSLKKRFSRGSAACCRVNGCFATTKLKPSWMRRSGTTGQALFRWCPYRSSYDAE